MAPDADPCTMDLSLLFVSATPADVEELRQLFCSINTTALLIEISEELDMRLLLPFRVSSGFGSAD